MGFTDTMKKLDIFGGQRGLTFSGEESHKTVVGAFFTVVYLLLVIFFTIIYIDDFFSRHENPIVASQTLITETSPHLNFRDNNFFFTIGLLYKGVYVKPSEIQKVLDITITQYTTIYDEQSNLKMDPTVQYMKPCTEVDFTIEGDMIIPNPDKSPGIFSLCLNNDTTQVEPLKIDGEFFTVNKSYISLEIKPCEGNIVECRNDLNTIIESERLEIIFGLIEVSINQNNFDNPFTYHFNTDREFSLFNSKTYVRKLFFEKSEVLSDIGTFQKEEEEKPSMNYKIEMNQDKDRLNVNDPFVEIEMYSSNDIFKITRDYSKIQDLLAKIGGILGILTLALGAVYSFYNGISLKLDIMNKALIKDKKKTLNFFNVLKFMVAKIFSGLGCGKCFSKETHELSIMYFNAEERVKNYLDVKAVVNNTRDVRLFRRIFFNKYQTNLLQKMENDTLFFEWEKHYLEGDDEKLNLKEAEKYIEDHQDIDDDVDRRINRFFLKLGKRVEAEKERLEKEANSKCFLV